jgi:glucose-6-phosphate isomerase
MQATNWQRYNSRLLRIPNLGITLDTSLMNHPDGWCGQMTAACQRALDEMRGLEGGAIANPDEGRMVGHYWLRNPDLAPPALAEIRTDIAEAANFASAIHSGALTAPGPQAHSPGFCSSASAAPPSARNSPPTP